MAELPSTVTIGHLRYALRRDQAYLDKEGVRAGHEYAGQSGPCRQLIAIAEELAPDYEAETVLHEILHQCLRSVGLDPDRDAKAGAEDVEERAVSGLSGPLLATLRANPDLVAYLLDLVPGT